MRRRWNVFLIYVALCVATIVAFEPVRHNDFVNYDDYMYVIENPQVVGGINRESIIWAFTSSLSANWHPLTWLSHMLDCELYDLRPFWHHLTSVLFHLANTLLLFWILKEMTQAMWPSAFVAAAFALHPLHVESVAWVAERKDVLSGFFWMLTIAAYIRYAKRPGIVRYLIVVSAFCMGLMSKPMVVTLPFVLLLLDYWPLGRFRRESDTTEEDLFQSYSSWRLIFEKIPLSILVAVVSVITFIFQQSAGALKQEDLPLSIRISIALVAYARYVGKLIFPSRLAVLYPLPVGDGLPEWQPIVSFVILACISMGVIFAARRYRYLVVGWLWYLGTLVPVIGLVRVGSHAMADRYTYLPSIGFFVMVAWGAAEVFARWHYRKTALSIAAGLILAALLVCTRVQVGYWKDSLTLFGHTLEVTENNYVINKNCGNVLYEMDRLDEALVYYQRSLQIAPFYLSPRMGMGEVLLKQGRLDKAVECFNDLLMIKPDYADAHFNLAMALMQQGKSDGVVEHFNEALEAKKNWPEVYYNLGLFYARQGEYDLAIQNYRRALELCPNYPEANRELIALTRP